MRRVLLEFVRKATGQVGCKLQHPPRRGCRGIIAHDSKEGMAAGMNQKKMEVRKTEKAQSLRESLVRHLVCIQNRDEEKEMEGYA